MRFLGVGALVLILLVNSCYSLLLKKNRTRYFDQFDKNSNPGIRKDYKLMYKAENWTTAADICTTDGGYLAVPRTKMDFDLLQKIVRSMHYPSIEGADDKLVAWLGISCLASDRWKTVLGEDIETLQFHCWALGNGQISHDPREPQCVVIDAANAGLRDFWCNKKQPFICEYVRSAKVSRNK